MSEHEEIRERVRSLGWKHLWPTPVGLLSWGAAIFVARVFGQRAFLLTHGYFEIGILIALVASVICSVNLIGKGRGNAPRWVLGLNLLFAPIIIGSSLVAWML